MKEKRVGARVEPERDTLGHSGRSLSPLNGQQPMRPPTYTSTTKPRPNTHISQTCPFHQPLTYNMETPDLSRAPTSITSTPERARRSCRAFLSEDIPRAVSRKYNCRDENVSVYEQVISTNIPARIRKPFSSIDTEFPLSSYRTRHLGGMPTQPVILKQIPMLISYNPCPALHAHPSLTPINILFHASWFGNPSIFPQVVRNDWPSTDKTPNPGRGMDRA